MIALLILVSVILFVLRALGVSGGHFDLGWLGLAFFAGSFLVGYLLPARVVTRAPGAG